MASLIEEFYVGVAPVLGERTRTSASQPTMPRPSDAFGQWSWATRPDITANTWREIRPADDRARFTDGLALTEGWLRAETLAKTRRNRGRSRATRKEPVDGDEP